MSQRARRRLVRQWELTLLLHDQNQGIGVARICRELDISRPTLYRYINFLKSAGVPIESTRVNGEVRYRLDGRALPSLGANDLQVAALQLARERLKPLDGTRLFAAVDELLGDNVGNGSVRVRADAASHARGFAADIERAIDQGRLVRARYRPWGRSAQSREFEPVKLLVYADHLYVHAWDLERRDWRTFKLARVESLTLGERSAQHPAYDDDELLRHAVGVWSGEPIDVRIKVRADFIRMAKEWPLHPEQNIDHHRHGWADLRATVAGLEECLRWVLRWGRYVFVEEPEELRRLVRHELETSLVNYR